MQGRQERAPLSSFTDEGTGLGRLSGTPPQGYLYVVAELGHQVPKPVRLSLFDNVVLFQIPNFSNYPYFLRNRSENPARLRR